MSSASSATGLIKEMELAQKDLAMYAAIIGCKPTVEAHEEPAFAAPVEEHTPACEIPEEDHPRRITLWMRHVQHEAKKRFDEARMRLAS